VALAVTASTNLIFTLWLRRSDPSAPRSVTTWHRVFLVLMLLDLVVLLCLLYYTGGHSNPFSIFYFVNLALSGMLLPPGRAWLLNGLAIVSFAALLYYHRPVAELRRAEGLLSIRAAGAVTLQHWGLLAAFTAAASVIVYFVTRLTSELRQRDEALRQAALRQARSQKWEALGTLSAGAAHELGTPLATIAIVTNEIERQLRSDQADSPVVADMEVIRKEVDRCRGILNRMSIEAGHATTERHTAVDPRSLVAAILNDLPDAGQVRVCIADDARRCLIWVPLISAAMAVRGVVQNALDASSGEPVELRLDRDGNFLRICVRDRGAGMTSDVLDRADEPFYTTKEAGNGMGLGRFLARSVIERVGGSFETESHVGVGTDVTIRIPLQSHHGNHVGPEILTDC
jgi:two-component system sensor histidine kinase RegB